MTALQTPVSLNINFDSFNEAFGFPKDFHDPCFFDGMDRFIDLANRYNYKATLYIIARDLENPEIAARVRDWHIQGHEIGSHSWDHPMDLGGLKNVDIENQIKRAHDKITDCIGTEPKGFTAPAWATSRKVIETLIDLDYLYDTSVFPSFMLYPVVSKVAVNHIKTPKNFMRAFNRRDFLGPFNKPLHPFYTDKSFRVLDTKPEKGLVVLPLPALSKLQFPLWHTVGFLLGWEKYARNVEKALQTHPYFYHLMHPADFTGKEDLTQDYRHGLERMDTPMDTKMDRLEQIFGLIETSGRPVKTMQGLAEHFLTSQTADTAQKVS